MPIRKKLKKTSQEEEEVDPLEELSDSEKEDKPKKATKSQTSKSKSSKKRKTDSSDEEAKETEKANENETNESEPFQLFISPKNSESQDQHTSSTTHFQPNNVNSEQPNIQQPPTHSVPKSRLMITKMVLENFKSYAGIQNIGPFHKSFSSIVGANGSGKSNVIDALLFVFGKRAKQLRHNKVSELIHHSEKFPNLSFCKVSVYFQDIIDQGDDYIVEEGSEIVVTRIGYENNTSKYLVNDKTVKWEEVEKILGSKGIDLTHNRFLILQGEVEQIAMMKPKAPTPHEEGLLEYLEDIIGTNKYVPAIEQKAQEVEQAGEERAEKLNRLKIAEKERENLESAKNEAEECLQKEREIIDKRSILFQIFRQQAENSASSITQKKTSLEEKLNKEREQATESMEKLAELENDYKLKKKEYDEIEKAMLDAKSDFAIYERKDVKHREDIKHFKSKSKKLNETIANETKKIREKSNLVESQTSDITKSEKEIEDLTKTKEKEEKILEKIFASLKDETSHLQTQLESKQKELMPWNKKLNEYQSKYDIANSELSIARDRVDTASKQLEEINATLKNISESLPAKKKGIQESRKNIDSYKITLEKYEKEWDTISTQEQEISEQVKQMRSQIEENKSNVRENSSRNKVLDSLMKAKSNKKLSGIHGRLGDLGSIDSNYDIAISTACGALNNIVVESTSEAEKCVQYLRSNNLGVATFIILEKIQHLNKNLKSPFSAPQNSQRLFDLVRVKDEIYLPAFYYALNDTLVTKNLDLATKIAFGEKDRRFRVVTLEGQLIDISGTMSGGGNKPVSGGMKASFSSEISPEQLASLEKECVEKSDRLQQIRRRKQELDKDMESLRQQISSLEVEIPKMEMDIKSLKTREEGLKARIPSVEKETQPSEEEKERIKDLEKKFKESEKELEKIKKVTSKLEEEAQALQQEILNAGGMKLKVQKAKVDSLSERIDTTNSNITKLQVQIKSHQKQISKSEEVIKQSEKELEEVDDNLKKTRDESSKGEQEALKVMENYKQAQSLFEKKGENLKDLQKTFEKIKKVVDKFRSIEVDIQNQIEEQTRIVKENENKAQHWSKKIADLNKQKSRTKIDEQDEDVPLPVLSVDDLQQHNPEDLQNEVAVLEEALSKMKPNMNAIREYRKKEKDYNDRLKELDVATEKRDNFRKEYESLRKKRLDEFMAGFGEITLRLKEMYQMITLGGDAELELVDSLDPFSEGIVFSVRPPKKSWKNISNLSGGEKTLSSLALVFALHHYKPTPLYVMDEIDAALDFKNVSIVANYIKDRTKNAQFIIISLRNYMFELADYLVGIFKTRDCSKSVTINPSKFHLPNAPVGNNRNSNTPITTN